MIRSTAAVAILALLLPTTVHAEPIQLPDGRKLEKIDFDRHVHALLDRQGCNAGACHGNRDGKGGFALSLFAASPEADHLEIARRWNGRYLNHADPERSLFLLKSTGQLKHDGGIRVGPDSWEYRLLRQWIVDGAARASGRGDLKSLHVSSSEHVFMPGETLPLKVFAEFSDGVKEDVTCFCDYRIPKQDAVNVDRTGLIQAKKPGDVIVGVFYRGRMRSVRAIVAAPTAKDFVYPRVPEVNDIDREVFRNLRRLNLVPSDLCTDEQFLRRLHIDILGTLPTPVDVRDFLAGKDADKRTKKIDEMLAHPRHAVLLALRLCEMTDLIGRPYDDAKLPRVKSAQMAHDWFRKRIHDNMPYDRIVAGVLTATSKEGRNAEVWLKEKTALAAAETGFGTDYAKRSTLDHFWRNDKPVGHAHPAFASDRNTHPRGRPEPIEHVAERVAAAFLGVNLECARCHLHPTDVWTPDDHQAFVNVFTQVHMEPVATNAKLPAKDQKRLREGSEVSREVYLEAPAKLRLDSRTSRAFTPRLLNGPVVGFQGDARAELLRWMVRPDNPLFARHFVDVLWEHYLGVSLIDTKQDRLLDLLARDFIAHRFDIRRLERRILVSRTYQLAETPNATNKHDQTCFSRAVPHRLNPRVSTEILHNVFETSEKFGLGVPAGSTAIEVMHGGDLLRSRFFGDAYRDHIERLVARFGRSDLIARCDEDSGRSYLHLYCSSEMNVLFTRSKRIDRLAKADMPIDDIIDECFLATLSRLPNAEHRKICRELLGRDPKMRRTHIENIFFALINTKEFTLRH